MTKTVYERCMPELEEETRFNHAVDNRTAYKEYGYDPYGLHRGKAEERHLDYSAGIHTRTFRGSAAYVGRITDKFHRVMFQKYANHRIIS